ncbi:MAG TPA: hypothetical protein VFL03_07670, partial [Candidatus Limnocylindrales bacterium]|nr:hypothetical protein [Candidatus Limnocylindrales bacterium]
TYLYLTADADQPPAASPAADTAPDTSSASTTPAWSAVAALLVVAGLVLVVLRWGARRLA